MYTFKYQRAGEPGENFENDQRACEPGEKFRK